MRLCSFAVACGERSRTMQLLNIIFCEDREEGPQIHTNGSTNGLKYLSLHLCVFVDVPYIFAVVHGLTSFKDIQIAS